MTLCYTVLIAGGLLYFLTVALTAR